MSDPVPVEGQHALLVESPGLTLIGVLVAIVRERFLSNIPSDPAMTWHWEDDMKTTEIFIESGFNENMEARNTRPGIWVDRTQTVLSKSAVGDQDQVPEYRRSGTSKRHIFVDHDFVIDCTSRKRGESMLVASIVQTFLYTASDIIQATFGLRDFSPIMMGRTAPFKRDTDLMNTTLEFRVQHEMRWAAMPISVVLSGISMRLSNAENPSLYFQQMTLVETNN